MKVWDPENEVWIYIPEEDVPLWNKVPQTGDESRTELWAALAAASLCGLAGLTLLAKKRKTGEAFRPLTGVGQVQPCDRAQNPRIRNEYGDFEYSVANFAIHSFLIIP